MEKLFITDLELNKKKALVRVDFNVPLNKDGTISDDTRIKEALPTIQYILDHGGSAILMSHMGRPKAKKDLKYTLAPCAARLSDLLCKPVIMAPDCIGNEVEKMAAQLQPGQVMLLENLRFYAAEEDPASDPSFVQKLAKLGDVYINDAFGTAHRAHASTAEITKYFPQASAAGFLIKKELSYLDPLLSNPKRPFYAIIGGSKISSKIGVLESLSHKVDGLFIGGGMAYTFFKAQGISIGKSIHEDEFLNQVRTFLKDCTSRGVYIALPVDLLIADKAEAGAQTKIISSQEGIPEDWEGVDIGPKTLENWKQALEKAGTIFWNGPVGIFEIPAFAHGTNGLASILSKLNATTIVGGGDSVAAINAIHLGDQFTHLSTGGGASLEYLEFGHLPGIDALTDHPSKRVSSN